ncbi:MAG: GTPase Era [Acidimicrobiaceae bacterium]|nr:GTPase Era [Acidimicrobiaceae bacterium]
MRVGFVSLVGRPNVGKSTLLNALIGKKVSIVSDKPQTTRTRVRGIVTTSDTQLVFVDTPGLHKASTALGKRVNATALESMRDVDTVCLVLDATQTVGSGDRWVSQQLDVSKAIIVLNKIDAVSPAKVMAQLSAASEFGAAEYFPVSAKTGEGVAEFLEALATRATEGDAMYPPEMVSETPQAQWVAELVREQLLAVTRDELPYSIATRVTEWEWPRVRCEIVVERESQKGMVIGKSGHLLKTVGIEVRKQLPAGAFLELFVVVDKDWQHRADRVIRLGY